jgi:hypothetical protein
MARIPKQDRKQYADYLGLTEKQITRLSDGAIRNRVIQSLPRENKEFDTTTHHQYTVPGNLPVSRGELRQLYQILSNKEKNSDAAWGSAYYSDTKDPRKAQDYPTDSSLWRRTKMRYPEDSVGIFSGLDDIVGEYNDIGVLSGYTFTFTYWDE